MKCCSDLDLAYSDSKNDYFHRVTEARVAHSCHLKNNQSFSVYAVKLHIVTVHSPLCTVCPLRLHQNIIFIQDYKSMHPFSTSYLYLRDRRLSRDDQTSVYPATSSRFSGETPKNSVSPAFPGLPTSLLSPGSELLILPLRPFRGSQGHVSRKQSQSFSHNL